MHTQTVAHTKILSNIEPRTTVTYVPQHNTLSWKCITTKNPPDTISHVTPAPIIPTEKNKTKSNCFSLAYVAGN